MNSEPTCASASVGKCRSFRKGFSSAFFFPFFISTLLFFSNLVYEGNVSAQVIDSIRVALHKRPNLIGSFGSNTSFINGFNSPIFTMYGELDFNHRVRTGLGLSWLQLSPYREGKDNTPFYLDKIIINAQGKADTVHPALSFGHFDWYLEYVFYKTKHWQFSVPLIFGIGNSKYKYTYMGVNTTENRHMVLLYQPSVSGYYKIFRWFGVGLDVGYRIMIISNKSIGGKFNSPVYNAYAIIFWDSLYKMFFPNTKLAKKLQG
jgi:hypothetical protein